MNTQKSFIAKTSVSLIDATVAQKADGGLGQVVEVGAAAVEHLDGGGVAAGAPHHRPGHVPLALAGVAADHVPWVHRIHRFQGPSQYNDASLL